MGQCSEEEANHLDEKGSMEPDLGASLRKTTETLLSPINSIHSEVVSPTPDEKFDGVQELMCIAERTGVNELSPYLQHG